MTEKVKRKIKRSGEFYVYIVKCTNGTYYTGYTNDLDARIKLHNKRYGAKYLRGKGPVELVWSKEYRYKHYAMKAEYKIKQINRKQKELLAGGMRLDKVLSRKNGK